MSIPSHAIKIRIPSFSPLMGLCDGNVWAQIQLNEESVAVLDLCVKQFTSLSWAQAVSIDVSTLVCWPGLLEEHFGPTLLEISKNPDDQGSPLLRFRTDQCDGARYEQAATEPISITTLFKHFHDAIEHGWQQVAIMPGDFYEDDIDEWPQNLQHSLGVCTKFATQQP